MKTKVLILCDPVRVFIFGLGVPMGTPSLCKRGLASLMTKMMVVTMLMMLLMMFVDDDVADDDAPFTRVKPGGAPSPTGLVLAFLVPAWNTIGKGFSFLRSTFA